MTGNLPIYADPTLLDLTRVSDLASTLPGIGLTREWPQALDVNYRGRLAREKRYPSIPQIFTLRVPVVGPLRPDAPPAVIRFLPSGLNRNPITHSGPAISRRIDKSVGFHKVIFPSRPAEASIRPSGDQSTR